jgi:hypothetical protein
MSRGVRIFPVGRRGARLVERQPAVRFPGPLICRSRLPTRASAHATAAPGRRPPARLLLEVHVGARLPVGVADDEAGVRLLDGPGRREAAGRHLACREHSPRA